MCSFLGGPLIIVFFKKFRRKKTRFFRNGFKYEKIGFLMLRMEEQKHMIYFLLFSGT